MLQSVVTNDLSKAAVGEALYNLVLNEGGGVIEDLIVYRLEPERYFVVPNARTPSGCSRSSRRRRPRAAPSDVSPGLVLPGGAGAGVGARDAAAVPRGGRSGVHAVRRIGVPAAAGDRDAVGVHGRGRVRAVHLPGHRAANCGPRSPRPWSRSGACPAGWPRATCSAWRWAIRSTARTCSSPSTALEAGLGWAVSFDKGEFRGRRSRCCDQKDEGLPEPAAGAADARAPAHPARRTTRCSSSDRLVGAVT